MVKRWLRCLPPAESTGRTRALNRVRVRPSHRAWNAILYCVGLKLASVIACICNHSRSSSATRAPSSLKAHAFVGSGLNPQDSKDRRELLEGDEGDRSSRENDVEPLLWQGSSLINSSNAIVLSSP